MNITYSNVNNIYIINSFLESLFKEYFAHMGGIGKTISAPSQKQFGKKKTFWNLFSRSWGKGSSGEDLFELNLYLLTAPFNSEDNDT